MRNKVHKTELVKKRATTGLTLSQSKNDNMQSSMKPKEYLAIMGKKPESKILCDCPTIKMCSHKDKS